MENRKSSLLREFERRQDALIERIIKTEPGKLIHKIGGVVISEDGFTYNEVTKIRNGIKSFQRERNSCKIKGDKVILSARLFHAYLRKSNFLLRPVDSVLTDSNASASIDEVLVRYSYLHKNIDQTIYYKKNKLQWLWLLFVVAFLLLAFSMYSLLFIASIVFLIFRTHNNKTILEKSKLLFEEENKRGLDEYLWERNVPTNTDKVRMTTNFPYQFEFVHTVPDFETKLINIAALAEEKDCRVFFLLHKSQSGYKFSFVDDWFKLTLYRNVVFGIEYENTIVFPFDAQLYSDFYFDEEVSSSLDDFFNNERGKVFSK